MTLIRPSALPDELAAGYLGRVFRINGYADPNRGLVELLDWAGIRSAGRREAPLIQAVAQIAGIELHQFVANHTMLPLRRAVSNVEAGGLTAGEMKSTTLWALAMRPTRPELCFCPSCVVEDIGFHGQSYWRREHQIPGQYFCAKHGEALQFAKAGDAAHHFPSEFLGSAVDPVPKWLNGVKSSAFVQRYLDLCTAALQHAAPWREQHVSKTALSRAKQLGLHTGKGAVQRRLLSELIRDQVDCRWLEAVIPTCAGLLPNQVWPPIDGVVRGKAVGYSTLAYLLAFAVMYEDADEAQNAIAAEPMHAVRTSKAPHTPRNVSAKELLRSYVRNQGSHLGVADEIDLDPAAASKQLQAIGLPRLGRMNPKNLEAAVDSILKGGKSIDQACKEVGISAEEVRRSLMAALAPLRAALKRMPSDAAPSSKNKIKLKRSTRRTDLQSGSIVESSV